MDALRFEAFLRTNTSTTARRGVLASLISGVMLGVFNGDDALAKKKRKKKKRKKKTRTAPLVSAAPLPCADGVKNGTESDIDCGGTCARCGNNKVCNTRDDCASAYCDTLIFPHVCQSCVGDGHCPNDADGACVCDTTVQGQKVCDKALGGVAVASCAACPPGTSCVEVLSENLQCYKLCGAA